MARESKRWLVLPGHEIHLDAVDPRSTDGAPGGKKQTIASFEELNLRLADLQARLWAESDRSLLVVLQAMDAGGKDGVIKHVFGGVNPQGTKVTGFKVPTEEEQGHDFLWRVHKAVPGRGEIGIFNRSHYEDVLVVRVHELVPETVWRKRYEHINHFESNLVDRGTAVVKLYLHISKAEQAERFGERLEDPSKRWKFRAGDLDDRAKWAEFMAAYEEAVNRTTTEAAPWYVIPADRNWYRDWAVTHVLIDALEAMDPKFPEPEEDLSGIVIE